MDTRKMKLALSAGALALSMALAGCGGGGSSGGPVDTGPTLEERQTAERGSINTAISAANTAVGAVMDDSDDAVVAAADTAISNARAAISMAEDLPATETSALSGQVDQIETRLGMAKSNRTTAMNEEAEQTRIANQKKLNDASMQVAMAIDAHKVSTTPPSEFASVAISRGSGNAKITPMQTAADRKNKPFMMDAAPDAGAAWTGHTFTRENKTAKRPYTEMAAVYTDIKMAGSLPWTATGFGSLEGFEVAAPTGTVTITANTAVDAMHLSGILPAATSDDAKIAPIAGNTDVSGMLYGVQGTYTCTSSSACSVTRNAKDMVTFGAGVTFTPLNYDDDPEDDGEQTMAKYAKPDMDYVRFGYWAKATEQRDTDLLKHEIHTFYGGGMAARTDLETGLEGPATYYGAAAGVYVKKDGADDKLVVTDGHFTADAMLTANFGGNRIAAANHNEVTGKISKFMDGSTNLGFADLKLGTSSKFIAESGMVSGETHGGGESGNWTATFYGSVNTANDDGGSGVLTDNYPRDVAGEFNGHFVNGHVAGAFGAEYE